MSENKGNSSSRS